MRQLDSVVTALIREKAYKATKFISPTLVVSATLRRYRGRLTHKGRLDFVVKVGKPNYLERRFIEACKKAGEPFPVRKVQIKLAPKKRGR